MCFVIVFVIWSVVCITVVCWLDFGLAVCGVGRVFVCDSCFLAVCVVGMCGLW